MHYLRKTDIYNTKQEVIEAWNTRTELESCDSKVEVYMVTINASFTFDQLGTFFFGLSLFVFVCIMFWGLSKNSER